MNIKLEDVLIFDDPEKYRGVVISKVSITQQVNSAISLSLKIPLPGQLTLEKGITKFPIF